ncbi:MAG: chloride channel protein [Fibrobacter sp.]|nr:chloride channel protein [Fibrobacter sp.]
MNFSDFSRASQQFNQFSPEMKEQMMRMAKARVKEKLTKWLAQPTLIALSVFVGAIIGALTACFGDIANRLITIRETYPLFVIPFLALAGAGIVFAFHKWGRYTDRGMDQVFAVGLGKENEIPMCAIPMAAITSWLTQFFGGSAGREGAAMQMGATFAYNISKKLPFENASHILLISGMAAGFAGIFQAPMAATAFALEVLLVGHFELAALLPAAAAAFTAAKISAILPYTTFTANLSALITSDSIANSIFGSATFNGLQATGFNAAFFAKLALLGILFGVIGGGFAKLLGLSQNFFAKKLPNPIKRIAFFGLGLSAVMLVFFQGRYAGLGTNLLDLSFGSAATASTAATASFNTAAGIYSFDWVLKFALTIVTLAVGFVGGAATPLFAIGATFGIFIAGLVGIPLPLAAALGFAAVFGAATNTLWAPILIGVEIFGFDCLPAFFIVCVIAYACNGGQSIYKQKKIRLKLG